MNTLGKVKVTFVSIAACIEVHALIAMLTASAAMYAVQTSIGTNITAWEYAAILCGIIGGWLARSGIAWFDK